MSHETQDTLWQLHILTGTTMRMHADKKKQQQQYKNLRSYTQFAFEVIKITQ